MASEEDRIEVPVYQYLLEESARFETNRAVLITQQYRSPEEHLQALDRAVQDIYATFSTILSIMAQQEFQKGLPNAGTGKDVFGS